MLKRFTCLMILIIFFLNLIFPILSIATDEIVTIKFEDEKLYNAIVEKIGKKIANNDDSTYTIQINNPIQTTFRLQNYSLSVQVFFIAQIFLIHRANLSCYLLLEMLRRYYIYVAAKR